MSRKTRVTPKADADDEGGFREYSSPACFMHELDDAGQVIERDMQTQVDVTRWRKAERERLIAARLATSADERQRKTDAIIDRLNEAIGDVHGKMISTYWPFRGEPDLRGWMESIAQRGYGVSQGGFESGISTIAAPVFDEHQRITAAVSVTVPSQQFDPQALDEIVAQVCEAAARLSQRISHLPPPARRPQPLLEKTPA